MNKIKMTFKIMIILFISLLLYSALVEPNRLIVRKYDLDSSGKFLSDKLESNERDDSKLNNKSNKNIKIIHITDTQIGYFYSTKKLSKVVEKVNSLDGGIVVFTGDLIDRSNKNPNVEEITKILSGIHSNKGKFAAFGNHDYVGKLPKYYRQIMKDSGFRLLVNDSEKLDLSFEKSINIIGADEILSGNFDIEELKSKVSKEDFNLLLMHEPDLIDRFNQDSIELTLSGHSHGGQVGIPIKGALIGPPYGRKYTKGFYDINGNNLYVSSGLGSTRIPFRLFNPPEIIEFNINLN